MTVRSIAVRDQVQPREPYIKTIDSAGLTGREVLALRLAGSLADRPYRLGDELIAELRTEFGDDEIMEMIFACALFSWGNILGIATHLDTVDGGPYGMGLDYVEGARRKMAAGDTAGHSDARTVQ